MHDQRDEFEEYLRRFQPRAPRARPLPWRRPAQPARVWMAAAAAVLAGIVTYTAWSVTHPRNTVLSSQIPAAAPQDPIVQATLGWLSRAAIADPDALDKLLIDTSPRLLPRVDRPEGTLATLAKE